MNRKKVQINWTMVFVAILFIGLILLAIYVLKLFIQGLPAFIEWVSSQAANLDSTVMAAVITGSLTIVGSVYITSLNARRAQENAAAESNRGKKIDIYNSFVVSLTGMLKNQKTKGGQLNESDVEFMHDFASQLMVHGGPAVIEAFGEWRTSGDNISDQDISNQDRQAMVERVEKLLLEMRKDLGISNKRLKKNELLGLIIIGGKPELDTAFRESVEG